MKAMIKISAELAQTLWRHSDKEIFELYPDGSESELDDVVGEGYWENTQLEYGIEGEIFGKPYKEK